MNMRAPGFGEANLGAMAGAVVGGIGGLFALGIAPAIIARNPAYLVQMPLLGLGSLIICGIFGWLLGGQIGYRIGDRLRSEKAEIITGALTGLVPVILMVLLGWYLSVG
jgi:hypothetical protein